MWRLKASRLVLAGMLACRLATGELWAYCTVCQTALLSSPEGQQMAGGFNTGILFLLGAPFLVAATVALAVFKVHRRVRLRWLARKKRPQGNQHFPIQE